MVPRPLRCPQSREAALRTARKPERFTRAGIGSATFRKWVRQNEANCGERDDRLTSKDAEELKRLRRENTELKRTNEILRLASAFFAQEADPTRRRS